MRIDLVIHYGGFISRTVSNREKSGIWKRLKAKLKEITRKTAPMSFDERIRKLKEVQRGWVAQLSVVSCQLPVVS